MAKLFVNINGQLAEIGKGKSAYEIAVDGGYSGTQQEWLESLKGSDGKDGKDGRSVTSVNKDSEGNVVVTFSDGEVQNIGKLTTDIKGDFLTPDGFGNLRYYDGRLQYFNSELQQWSDITTSAGGSNGINFVYDDGTVIENAEIVVKQIED